MRTTRRPRPGPPCGVAVVAARLSAEDARDLLDLLDDPTVRSTDLERALRKRDHDVSAPTIARHRRDDCSCSRA